MEFVINKKYVNYRKKWTFNTLCWVIRAEVSPYLVWMVQVASRLIGWPKLILNSIKTPLDSNPKIKTKLDSWPPCRHLATQHSHHQLKRKKVSLNQSFSTLTTNLLQGKAITTSKLRIQTSRPSLNCEFDNFNKIISKLIGLSYDVDYLDMMWIIDRMLLFM